MVNNVVASKQRCGSEDTRQFRTYAGSLICAALLLVVMAAYFLWNAHQQAVAQADLTTSSLANLLESRVEHDLGRLTSLLHVVDDVGRPHLLDPSAGRLDLRRNARFPRELEANFVAITQISIVDAKGQLFYVYDPAGVVAQIPDFTVLSYEEKSTPYFSDVYSSDISSGWFMDHGVPMWTADGQLLGMVIATINLTHYADLLRSIDVGKGGVSLVRRTDNSKLILRHPRGDEHDFNNALPWDSPIRQRVEQGEVAGTLPYVASTDGTSRLGSFRRVDRYPFYVQVSLGESTYLAGWRHQTLIVSLILLAFLILVAASIRSARRNMLERVALTQAVAESEQRFRSLFENNLDAVVVLDAEGISACNQAALEMFGVADKETFLSLNPELFFATYQADGKRSVDKQIEMRRIVSEQGKHRFEWLCRRYDTGEEFTAEVMLSSIELDGQNKRLAHLRDFTERKKYEERINQLAFYDPLTQLPNRRLLLDRLIQACAQSRRTQRYGALLVLDLDNFKPLNDKYGHLAGDLLLQEAATRLLSCVRAEDTVARLGGDEFVVLLAGLSADQEQAREDAGVAAEKILEVLAQPYLLSFTHHSDSASVHHHCSASLGLALFDGDTDVDEILGRADRAMYQAKADGRGVVRQDA